MMGTTGEATQAFDFMDGGRTYTCHVEARRGGAEAWWWFDVSGDSARYAPFRAEADDTPETVGRRIAAYYEDRLARRGGAPWRDRGPADAQAPEASALSGPTAGSMVDPLAESATPASGI